MWWFCHQFRLSILIIHSTKYVYSSSGPTASWGWAFGPNGPNSNWRIIMVSVSAQNLYLLQQFLKTLGRSPFPMHSYPGHKSFWRASCIRSHSMIHRQEKTIVLWQGAASANQRAQGTCGLKLACVSLQETTVHISSQLCVWWHYVGSLKLTCNSPSSKTWLLNFFQCSTGSGENWGFIILRFIHPNVPF